MKERNKLHWCLEEKFRQEVLQKPEESHYQKTLGWSLIKIGDHGVPRDPHRSVCGKPREA